MLVLNYHGGHAHPSSLALHGCVEVVLDSIVWAARHVFGHLGPSGTHLIVQVHDLSFLFRGKGCLVDCNRSMVRYRTSLIAGCAISKGMSYKVLTGWVKVVVPPLSTLLASA